MKKIAMAALAMVLAVAMVNVWQAAAQDNPKSGASCCTDCCCCKNSADQPSDMSCCKKDASDGCQMCKKHKKG